jgi:DNA-binding MarR family transcriptional regulator
MTTPRWLDEREREAWVRLGSLIQLLPAALDTQLRRDSDVTHFEYWVLAMLSEAPERTLRMTALAERTSATLSRLSHVVSRMEERGLVERRPCPSDRRATNATLTDVGYAKLVDTAPGHVEAVRELVFDGLTSTQVDQLTEICEAILLRVDPDATRTGHLRRP